MMSRATLILLLFIVTSFVGQSGNNLVLKQATGHPMQYYVSVPIGWSTNKQWPVVMVLEAAEKQYELNAGRFAAARGEMPFIIVAPIHTGNGNQGRRDPILFPYSNETWDYIERVGDCQFNDEGIRQVMSDIQKEFNAEGKVYLTGFEAGAHVLWSMIFNHPEKLKAVAPVAGNYRGRCVDINKISQDDSKESLPIMGFAGKNDEGFGPSGTNFNQWLEPKNIATKNGFKNIKETFVETKGHEPMPAEVLNYFNKLRVNSLKLAGSKY